MKSFNDSLTGKYLRIALPAALEGIFMTFLAAADLIMVGVLGAKAIAAVSIFLPLRLVLLTVSRSLASAVTILTANKFGSGQYSTIKVLLRQSFTVSSILLVVLHLLFYGFFEKLVVLMGAQRDYLELALSYGNIAVAAVLLNSLSLLLPGNLVRCRPDKRYYEKQYCRKCSEYRLQLFSHYRLWQFCRLGCAWRGNQHDYRLSVYSWYHRLDYEA